MTPQIATVATLAAAAAGYLAWQLRGVHRWPVTGNDHGYALVDVAAITGVRFRPELPDGGINRVLRDLDRHRVGIDGVVHVGMGGDGSPRTFYLYDGKKGWGGGPDATGERLLCTVSPDRAALALDSDMTVRAFGVLHVGPDRDDAGAVTSVYRLDVERVDPVP